MKTLCIHLQCDVREGKVRWQVLDSSGAVLQDASDKFDLQVLSYTVSSALVSAIYTLKLFACRSNGKSIYHHFLSLNQDNGIFEPGALISVEKVVIKSSGGLDLPAG